MSEADPELTIPESPRQAYYAEAASWAQDRAAAQDRSRRLAWGLAAAAGTIAALEALALIALAPLKTVVPYTLLVDRNTGFVEALDPTHPPTVKAETALTRSLLAQYVVAREGFDVAGLPEQYQKVALWSAEGARREYLSVMAQGNPDNPLSRYPRSTVLQAHVESVSPVASDAALVRFYTEQSDPDQGPRPRAFYAAMVRYRFSGEPMALADRLINPLGFQVVSYRRDQEAPPPEALPVAPATALPAPRPLPGAAPIQAAPTAAPYPRPAAPAARPGVIQTL